MYSFTGLLVKLFEMTMNQIVEGEQGKMYSIRFVILFLVNIPYFIVRSNLLEVEWWKNLKHFSDVEMINVVYSTFYLLNKINFLFV